MRILIADDDPFSRTLLVQLVTGLGHEVVAVPDGTAAWEELRRERFTVLITDWMMPGVSGPELCRLWRRIERDRYTYIIMLTAHGEHESFREGMGAGADDFLTKPINGELLTARLTVAERILGLRRHVRQLEGLLPICAYCKRIRDDEHRWQQIESYVTARSETTFTHGICPECQRREFPGVPPAAPPGEAT